MSKPFFKHCHFPEIFLTYDNQILPPMKNIKFLPVTVMILVFTGSLFAQTNSLTAEQKSWLSKANRHEKDGWINLHIEGEPFERGFQHGYLLAPEIKDALAITVRIWEYTCDTKWKWVVDQSTKMFLPHIDPENLAEIDGIVEGLKVANVNTSREEMITYNGFFELIWYWWPMVRDSITHHAQQTQHESCSSFIATGGMTADGKIVLGHNFWNAFYYPVPNIILDILPAQGNRMLLQAFAGLIHSGSDFFVTSAGLVGSETTISDFNGFDPSGIPEFVRMRRAMQDASSIEQWCEIMKKGNNGGYANAWLIGDVKTNEIARLELGLKCIGYEKKSDGFFVGSNGAEDPCILRRETTIEETDIRKGYVARKVRWNQLMEEYKNKIDIEVGKVLLSDHYDTYINAESPSPRTICGHDYLEPVMGLQVYAPFGAMDGKVINSHMAKNMSFEARWGSSCGMPFDADKFLIDHPQYGWMKGLLKNRPSQKWTTFTAGEKQ
jgi:hypothetical protein